jgi:hypothetical protein
MAGFVRVQHAYKHKSGLPEDDIVNTWYFATNPTVTTTAAATELADAVCDFYDSTHGSTGAVRTYIAETQMAPLRHHVKVYDMLQAKPRAPIYERNDANGTANNTGTAMPSELAVAMSYRGELASGIDMARRRGRIFLGPLNATVMDVDTATNVSRPPAAFRDAIIGAAGGMRTRVRTAGWEWVLLSTTNWVEGEGLFGPGVHVIRQVSVDNAFDIIRKRGKAPSVRTMGPVWTEAAPV